MQSVIIRHATVVTQGELGTLQADVLVENGLITAVGTDVSAPDDAREIDATGCIVTPGVVQTHVHLCQTAFSGLAEDLDVMSWLDQWIWPLEQALDADTMSASARWGVAEMLLSGTTSFLSMETTHHTDQAFQAAADLGARATIGKAIMDREEPGTRLLGESTEAAWADLVRLVETWHGSYDDRIRVAVSPRAPSAATPQMWADSVALASQHDLTIHTHVNENRGQSDKVSEANGTRDVLLLSELGALGPRTVLAHCVWLEDEEVTLLAGSGTTVAHCPTANLKLGSGIANVPRLRGHGVNVGLGTDGAACNNTLDARRELFLASIIHRASGDPQAMPASQAFDMATLNGARALGREGELGAIAVGMIADIAVFRAPQFTARTGESAVDHLVYSGSTVTVSSVLVGGELVVHDGQLVNGDIATIRAEGAAARATLAYAVAATRTVGDER
ncbi:MAG: hypothetical protein JWQ64_2991 [Subtercola sp.]|nr:hypothetical protein [Subtercola sp.]